MLLFAEIPISNSGINTNFVSLEPTNLIQSIISFTTAVVFGWLISKSYKYSSQSLSGGRQIASSLLPLTITVCLIITVVKSSLALSLGLVGALSIVRFRTPIKDPEDLVYLFLAIVCGLGFGANRNLYTTIGISSILFILNLRSFFYNRSTNKLRAYSEYNLNLEWDLIEKISLEKIVDMLSLSCEKVSLIRVDRSSGKYNLVLQIGLSNEFKIEEIINNLTRKYSNLSVQIYSSAIDW